MNTPYSVWRGSLSAHSKSHFLSRFNCPIVIKALLGHSTNDVTETHYIDRMVETLRPHVLLLDEYYEKYGISREEIIRKAG